MILSPSSYLISRISSKSKSHLANRYSRIPYGSTLRVVISFPTLLPTPDELPYTQYHQYPYVVPLCPPVAPCQPFEAYHQQQVCQCGQCAGGQQGGQQHHQQQPPHMFAISSAHQQAAAAAAAAATAAGIAGIAGAAGPAATAAQPGTLIVNRFTEINYFDNPLVAAAAGTALVALASPPEKYQGYDMVSLS
ncbi:unnamed protein product [Callosobruchus maculatus]|uniref:Uncharacterized protein n=1 Tax=Callosobruchus maculatus TaxID=64391 RepID=A0A653DQZ7_CALMS|nr:unnamed protein product [Callosobruchus maculatus]